MLLPSALSCDPAQSLRHERQPEPQSYFSPPSSPSTRSSAAALGNIMSTCRSLQSLVSMPGPVAVAPVPITELPSLAQLPTPPMAYAVLPMKLRLPTPAPARASPHSDGPQVRNQMVTRLESPRGIHKRRRSVLDESGREDASSSSLSSSSLSSSSLSEDEKDDDDDDDDDDDVRVDCQGRQATPSPMPPPLDDGEPVAPLTPKRARVAPESLPLGLVRSDFHAVHQDTSVGQDAEAEVDGQGWSVADDRVLVEVVLEKLQLSKSEWHDCARTLGMDKKAVLRRWKSLMFKGEVGLKTTGNRHRNRSHSSAA